MKREMITAMSAAQRLKISVADVEALWEKGELIGKKEFSQLYVEKESVYAYSGLKEGKQNKKGAGRKPNVMTFEDTAAYLSTDLAGAKKLVDDDVFEVVEGAGGVRGPKEALVKMYQKKMEGREVAAEKTEKKSVKSKNKDEASNDKTASNPDKPKSSVSNSISSSFESSKESSSTPSDTPKGKKTTESETEGTKEEKRIHPKSDAGDEERIIEDGDKIHLDKEMSLDDVMKEPFPGIKLMSEELRGKALGKCKKCEVKYNEHDMKEVAEVAYKMGKLAVYESLSEFKRKKPEKLVTKKAKVK